MRGEANLSGAPEAKGESGKERQEMGSFQWLVSRRLAWVGGPVRVCASVMVAGSDGT